MARAQLLQVVYRGWVSESVMYRFLTESNANAPVQKKLLARPPARKLAVPCCMSGAYREKPRRMTSYERNLRREGEGGSVSSSVDTAYEERERERRRRTHMTPIQLRKRSVPVKPW